MVGLFINTLPVAVDVNPEATIADALASRQDQGADYRHLSLPRSAPPRAWASDSTPSWSTSRTPWTPIR